MKKLSLFALSALVGSSLALGFAPQLPASAATTASASLVATGTSGSSANSGVGDSGLGQAWGVSTTLAGSTRWTVFESSASNLIVGDTNAASDIFVTNGLTVTRLSVSASGAEGGFGANSFDPTICASGRKVVFTTDNEWDATDANGAEDVYVIDRDADNDQIMDEFSQSSPAGVTTTLVSQSYNSDTGEYDISYLGANSGVISDDCNKVAFVTDMDFTMDDLNFGPDVYVRDLTSATTPLTWASKYATNGSSGGGYLPAISGDGSKVVVTTEATDLVSDSGTVGGLVMRSAGVGSYLTRTPAGLASTGTLADSERPAAITPAGTCVAFKADRGYDLVAAYPAVPQGIFLWDNRTGTPVVSLISKSWDGVALSSAANPRISDDCRFVAYQSGDEFALEDLTVDQNSKTDVYLYDTVENTTTLISTNADGDSSNGESSVAALDWDPTTNDGVVLMMSSASNIGGAAGGNSTIDLFSVPFSVTHDLSVTQVGNGTVTSDVAGISLSAAGTDTASYDALDTVTLTATAASGWQFAGWTGACTGTSTCSVTMGEARTVTATFTEEVLGGLTSLEAPVRLLNTRTSGIEVGKTDGTGDAYDLTVAGVSGIPADGVVAVAMNVTVVDGEASNVGGYVTVYPCGTRPDSSNLNFVNGQTVPNAVIAPVSNDGHVCFYVYGKAHLLADVSGYFTEGFTSLSAPTRLLNTRTSGVKVGKTDGTGTAYELTVAGEGGLPAAGDLSTVAMNVTVVDGEASNVGGYVTVYPCGTRPDSSNLNFVNGQTVPNAVIASVSPEGKVCFYVYGKAHLLADVSGYFDNSLTALEAPVRLLNTRTSGIKVGKTDGTGDAYDLTVAGAGGLPASGMTSVALNVTVVDGEASNVGGYVTVYPCGTRPDSSNLNFVNGQTVPNAVIAPVSNTGHVCFYVYGKAHLLVDASGYFGAQPV